MRRTDLINKLSAVLVVLFTPFHKDGEIDVEGLKQNISFLLEKSKKYSENLVFIVGGSLSEFYSLSEDERKLLIKTVVDEAGGKVPIIAGTGHSGTKPAIELSKYAEDVGADGVMVVLPYYFTPEKDGMYNHYKAIADAINIGIIIYNNPEATKAQIDPDLMSRMVNIENIIGLKENSTDLLFIRKMMKYDGKIRVIIGKGEFWYTTAIPFGCKAFVSSMANFYPEFSLELLKLGKKGDVKAAWKLIEEKYLPLQEFTEKVARRRVTTSIMPLQLTRSYVYVAVRKAIMNIVGLHGGGPRLPLTPLTEEEKKELKEVVEKIGLI